MLDLSCQAQESITAAFTRMVGLVARGTAEFVVDITSWWTTTSSVNVMSPAVTTAQTVILPLALAIMVGSILVQAIRIIISRKGEPLMLVASGLLRYAIASALGMTVLQAALTAADALTRDVLGDAATKFATAMAVMLNTAPTNLWAMLVLSFIAALLAIVQWTLMALRQAGLLVLAATVPLAASGSLTRATRGWLDRLMGWLLAIVAYKPAAAFVYYIGFSYMSDLPKGDISTLLTGVLVLGLAVVAMPVLLRFFSWTGTQLGGSGGGGSGALAAAGAVSMLRSGRGRPVDRAAVLQATGPGTGPTGAAPTATAGGAAAGGTAAGGAAAGGAGGAAAAAGGPAGIVIAAAAAARAAGQGVAGRMAGGPPPTGGSR